MRKRKRKMFEHGTKGWWVPFLPHPMIHSAKVKRCCLFTTKKESFQYFHNCCNPPQSFMFLFSYTSKI
jgi:hypothetical protein